MDNGRVWLITGATSGFGRALDDAVLGRGERVVATARRVEALSELDGENVLAAPLDVTREEQIAPALDAAIKRFGRVDVLVNKPGIGFVGALEEMSIADLRDAMEVMFFGPSALMRAVIPGCARSARARSFRSARWAVRSRGPAKAAAAILSALDADEPPLRLALGVDAVDGLRAKHASLEAELSRWEDLARTTEFDG